VPTETGAYTEFYAAFRRAMLGDAPPPVDPRDAVAVLEVIERARAAAG
jgi:scyllo-inositol 2-dehydrogenase (NADP+)